MEPQPHALQMQREMIRQIESAHPKFLIFVDVSLSWLVRKDSEYLIFRWLDQYQRRYYKQVGVVDINSSDKTIFRWGRECEGYLRKSKYGLLVFEQKSGF